MPRWALVLLMLGACSDATTPVDAGVDASADGAATNEASADVSNFDAGGDAGEGGAGTLEAGMLCGPGECASGLECASLAGDAGVCERVCTADQDCVSPGGLCEPVASKTLCSPNCDPTTSAGCGPGLACRIGHETSGAMRYYTTCGLVGDGGQAAPCSVDSDCRAGETCASLGQSSECARDCNVQAPSCPNGTTCMGFNPTVTIGATTYGACL